MSDLKFRGGWVGLKIFWLIRVFYCITYILEIFPCPNLLSNIHLRNALRILAFDKTVKSRYFSIKNVGDLQKWCY